MKKFKPTPALEFYILVGAFFLLGAAVKACEEEPAHQFTSEQREVADEMWQLSNEAREAQEAAWVALQKKI